MHAMIHSLERSIFCCAMAVALCGCAPALNWREVRVDESQINALLPCKPDKASRNVSLRVAHEDVNTSLSLQGCEASGMQFTLGTLAIPKGLPAEQLIEAWRIASLAAMGLPPSAAAPKQWALSGGNNQNFSVRAGVVTESNQVQWAWFAHDGKIYQAAIYGQAKEKDLPEAAENYFSGIKLR